MNEPRSTASKLCTGWLWQFDGQWKSTSDQSSEPAGRTPSCASTPPPSKSTGWPALQVKPAVGEAMTAVGGVFPAVTATVSVADAPRLSVTRSPTGYAPGSV